MRMRSMTKVVGALALVAALTLGSTMAVTPAGANPTDVYSQDNVQSKQYSLGGCLYKVTWGNFGPTPYTRVHFYNLGSCGGAVVVLQYHNGTTIVPVSATTVSATGSDGCGSYQVIQATGSVGFALRGLVWVGTGAEWYALDGLNTQPIHSHC